PPPPANTAPPTISGTAQQGQTLTESHGTWTNEPTSYSYQWQRCNSEGNSCTRSEERSGEKDVRVAADVGHTITVQASASNAGGPGSPSTSAASAAVTPPAPTNTAPPTISGTPQQGQTLTESHGTWTNEPTSYNYQWQRCNSEGNSCTAISQATNQTYVPVAADVGHTITVQEDRKSVGEGGGAATSAATAAVNTPGPTKTAPPKI